MSEVKIDLEVLESTITVYRDSIEEIRAAIRHADEAMETLRSSGWNTSASKAFFERYNMDWKPQFEANLTYLIHLYDCLKVASEKYWAAYESKI